VLELTSRVPELTSRVPELTSPVPEQTSPVLELTSRIPESKREPENRKVCCLILRFWQKILQFELYRFDSGLDLGVFMLLVAVLG